jgi:AcrR family transcriptional regulator
MAGRRSSRKTRAAAKADEEVSRVATKPRDVRSALLEAAEAVIIAEGLPRASLEQIAAKAKVSLDVLRGYFSGKPAILRALGDKFSDEVGGATKAATGSGIWANTAPRDFIEVCVRSILDVIFEREALIRALLGHGTLDPAVSASLVRIGSDLTTRVHGVLAECAGRPRIDRRRLGFALSMSAAVGHQAILLARDWSGEYIPRDEVTNETVRAACAYLGL